MAFLAVDENRNRTVVVNLHKHMFLEAAGFDLQASVTHKLYEFIKKRLGLLGWSGIGEAGAASFACAGVESKLAYHQYFTGDIEYG